MSAAPRIAVLGSINVDVVVRAQRLPRPGETLRGTSFALALGGKGANQACAAARLGCDVTFIARTGADGFAAFARGKIAAFGVSDRLIGVDDAAGTGMASIAVDAAGENAITIVAGANATVSPADAENARTELSAAHALLLQCETPFESAVAAAKIVKAAGGTVILDPAPAPEGGVPADLMALADLVTPNESEAAALTGIAVSGRESALAAARKLRANGAKAAIVKLGGAGLVFSSLEGEGFVAPFVVHVVDTVAAGDCFNAGLARALADGANLSGALRFAAACGAIAVTRTGAAEAAPVPGEVEKLLATAPAGY